MHKDNKCWSEAFVRWGGKLNTQRYYDGLCGKALFMAIWHADCDKIAIENPTPSAIFDYPKPTQAIQLAKGTSTIQAAIATGVGLNWTNRKNVNRMEVNNKAK